MPTNEERKEVAARLRVLASHAPADAEMVLDALDLYAGEYIEGFDPRTVQRLADLIEPEERTCEKLNADSNDILPRCSECGSLIGHYVNYCQMCGARVKEEPDAAE